MYTIKAVINNISGLDVTEIAVKSIGKKHMVKVYFTSGKSFTRFVNHSVYSGFNGLYNAIASNKDKTFVIAKYDNGWNRIIL